MNDTDYRALLEHALREVKRLRQERAIDRPNVTEPVAVIGMACRFPGAQSPEQLWQVASKGVDCIGDIPADRWQAADHYHPDPDMPGKMTTRQGGFLSDIRGFDAAFFGISPKEARSMDPQQRILLEVTWEAFEHAAIAPDSLYDSSVGVFLGLANLEYANLIRQAGGIEWIDSHFGTGNSASVASGRLAYHFGFRGPALTVDTACSSSLVAIHLAVTSLRRHECNVAVAAGINLMILPETFTHFSNARMLASDGRCKPFSSQADGYGRAEGCGVVLLKRLRDAIQDGDPIHAVVLGSASNHDGRSAGLTAPNGPSQEAVIHATLKDAGLRPEDVHMIEAHGTGTPLGDPIEAGALARVYGSVRTKRNPLHVSTIKANIGHAEAAAGIAGFIHACQCIRHRRVPPLLHMKQRSPHITWETLDFSPHGAELLTENAKVTAGVSSFGFSGTNAHVILQGYQQDPLPNPASNFRPTGKVDGRHGFLLSAKSEGALRCLIERYINWFEQNPEASLEDVCQTLLVGRTHWNQRLEFLADSNQEVLSNLKSYLSSGTLPDGSTSEPSPDRPPLSGGKPLANSPRVRLSGLPTYPFQHQIYWVPDSNKQSVPSSEAFMPPLATDSTVNLTHAEWRDLGEHRIFGQAVMPAVGWLELVSRIIRQSIGAEFEIRSVEFLKMLTWLAEHTPSLKVSLQPRAADETSFSVSTNDQSSSLAVPSSTYVQGWVKAATHQAWQGGDLHTQRVRFHEVASVEELYRQFNAIGLDYGPSFRRVDGLWQQAAEALGLIRSNHEFAHGSVLGLRLGGLDSALHVVAAAAVNGLFQAHDASAFIPVSIESVQWFDFDSLPAWSMTRVRRTQDDYALEADLFIWGEDGQPLLQCLGSRFEGFSVDPRQLPDHAAQQNTGVPESLEPQAACLAKQLLALPESARTAKLQEYLQTQLVQELELAPDSLLPEQSLADIGLDSLTVFRLGIRLESELGFAIDSRAMMRGISLHELTRSLLETLESLNPTDDFKRV